MGLDEVLQNLKQNIIILNIIKILPTEIKDAPTVLAFANGLDKFYAF